MKRLLWALVGVPVAVLLIVLSVANRQPVTLRLDPFNDVNPAISFTLPFFMHLFAVLLAGMIIGGLVVWLGQSKYRKQARLEKQKAQRFEADAAESRKRAEALAMQGAVSAEGSAPGLPVKAA